MQCLLKGDVKLHMCRFTALCSVLQLLLLLNLNQFIQFIAKYSLWCLHKAILRIGFSFWYCIRKMSVSRFGLKNIGLVYSVFSPSVYKTKQSADRFENQSTVRCEIFWSEVFSLQRFFTFFCFFSGQNRGAGRRTWSREECSI